MVKNSSNSSTGVGNASQPPKKQISPAKHWDFVLNNYTKQDIIRLENMDSSIVPVMVGQSEKGEGTGTKHLQVQISFANKSRPIGIFKKLLGHTRCSFRKVRDLLATRMYCSKEDTYDGTWRISRGWTRPRPLALITYDILNKYQKSIADYFEDPCDPRFSREIHWFWEPQGNMGKTILSTFFCDCRNALVVSGKRADAFFAIQRHIAATGAGPDVVIFDIPRCNMNYVSYSAVEKIKDGLFFSGKYESATVRFNRPHVICFANEEPDYEAVSADRWKIIKFGEHEYFTDACASVAPLASGSYT